MLLTAGCYCNTAVYSTASWGSLLVTTKTPVTLYIFFYLLIFFLIKHVIGFVGWEISLALFELECWTFFAHSPHLTFVCTGPGSVKDQLKLINEKFAGAAAAGEWQQTYPFSIYFLSWRKHVYTQLMFSQLVMSSCRVFVYVLNCSTQLGQDVRRRNMLEISSECPTVTLSVTLLREYKHTTI